MKRHALMIALGVAACGGNTSEPPSKNPPPLSSGGPSTTASIAQPPPPEDKSKELEKLATQAYVFGYPALFMEREERTMTTNVRLPLGTFAHASKLSRPEDADVLPSRDTLLSSAWLELHDGAWTLKLPDMGGRWFSIQMYDSYGEPLGAIDSAMKEKLVVITGPGFSGKLPAAAKQVESTTSTVWILGRTRVLGDADVAKVSALLKKWQLAPVPPAVAPKDFPPPPIGRPQDLKFGGPEIFDELGEVLKSQPPPKDVLDALGEAHVSLADLAKAGIGPGLSPTKTLAQEQLASVAQGVKDGAEQVEQELEKLPTRKNGWDLDATFGKRGVEPVRQAAFVLRGLDWPFASEGLVYLARVDDGDRTLSGAHQYAIHFDKDKLPPAKAFYSVTLYSARSAGLVPGAKRWAVTGSDLKKNADGSIDVFVQADAPPPKTPQSNWLPAPKGEAFMVALRVYEPSENATAWEAPPVKRVQ